ncbi:hypothetical protein [Micromonospora sp. NPDC049679]|uniref:hypothetical protein n=1 Tax=Micromonospora sp. NPDC049679 TaxID=3155920 RepID=UPI0033D095EB
MIHCRGERPAPGGAGAPLAWLGHPVTVIALVVLVVNDHVLKTAFPGWATGKLSDVAGMVLAPPLVAVVATLLVPRLPSRIAVAAGLASVGAAFTAVKATGYGAGVASAAWSVVNGPSVVLADPTDLLALPALAVAWWTWSQARLRPAPTRVVRVLRVAVVLPVALLGVAATSAPSYPDARGAAVLDGKLAVGEVNAYHDPAGRDIGWSISDDAGATWRPLTPGEAGVLDADRQPVRSACSRAQPARCYRIIPGRIRVEESRDGGASWRLSWEVTDDQRFILSRSYPDLADPDKYLVSHELAVLDATAGHLVVVANGRDGYAVRRADGRWDRVGFGVKNRFAGEEMPLPPLDGGDTSFRALDLLVGIVLAIVLAALVVIVAGDLIGRRNGLNRWFAFPFYPLLATAAGLAALVGVAPMDLFTPFLLLLTALFVIGLAVAMPIMIVSASPPPRWYGEVLLAAVLTLVLTLVALVGWANGTPVRPATAALAALAGTVPGLFMAISAARLGKPRQRVMLGDPPWPRPIHIPPLS